MFHCSLYFVIIFILLLLFIFLRVRRPPPVVCVHGPPKSAPDPLIQYIMDFGLSKVSINDRFYKGFRHGGMPCAFYL